MNGSAGAAPPTPERLAILAAALAATALAWLYLYRLAEEMAAMAGMPMPGMGLPWGAVDLALMFAMWWVMMLGMMLPSALPMLLTFAALNRRKRERGRPGVPTAVFAAGYLLAWGGFSLAATVLQWGLDRLALLTPEMRSASPLLGGAIFLAAGAYQFTPWKHACLRHCRSPFAFLLNHWRDGPGGALRMGLGHGLYCLGCCWALMAVLFAVGVMDLLWVVALMVFVLLEKLLPQGRWTANLAGLAMLAYGGWLLAAG